MHPSRRITAPRIAYSLRILNNESIEYILKN
jgi:hypothetical protein